MSYKKIAFNNENLSMPFFESLKQLAVENIPFISQPRENGEDNKRRDHNETDSDWLLLNDFVKLLQDPNIPVPNLITCEPHLFGVIR